MVYHNIQYTKARSSVLVCGAVFCRSCINPLQLMAKPRPVRADPKHLLRSERTPEE